MFNLNTTIMLFASLVVLICSLGCNVVNNDEISGLNPGCNFAGVCVQVTSDISTCFCCSPGEFGDNVCGNNWVCVQVTSDISTCFCCSPGEFGDNVCGNNWVCDRNSSSFQCYEFSSNDCSKVKQYVVVNMVFVTENEDQNQESDIKCNKWPGLFGQGVTSKLSHDLGAQVQYVASNNGWPGAVKSRGLCEECTPVVPCTFGDEIITSGLTFAQQFDLNLYYDKNCSVDYWIYDNVVECAANYDYGQSAYFVWKSLVRDSSTFVGDMNNVLQMKSEDNRLGKSWNNTKIVGFREVVMVITNKDYILTAAPTRFPSNSPTVDPTQSPTDSPTAIPTSAPSTPPTQSPTESPTTSPTANPTFAPTRNPTGAPTDRPTANPTRMPTFVPTRRPTRAPTKRPTDRPTREPTASAIPFYRYYNTRHADHFYTTNFQELRHGGGGWTYERVECKIYPSQVPGTVPLYRYYHVGVVNHFYTTNINEIGTATPGRVGRFGYKSEGVAGYCYPSARRGTRELYRYYNHPGTDHFYTVKYHGRNLGGWKYEMVACWVPKY